MLRFVLAAVPIIILLIGMIALNKPAMKVAPITLVITFILGLVVFQGESMNMVNTALSGILEGVKIIFLVMTTGPPGSDQNSSSTTAGAQNA